MSFLRYKWKIQHDISLSIIFRLEAKIKIKNQFHQNVPHENNASYFF